MRLHRVCAKPFRILLAACSVVGGCTLLSGTETVANAQSATDPASSSPSPAAKVKLVWDQQSTVIVDDNGGTYPRLLPEKNGNILCTYDVTNAATGRREQVVRISSDGGATWGNPITIRSLANNDVANGQMIQLENGTILCAYRVVGATKTLEVSESKNGGKSWHYLSTIISNPNGEWEPFLYLLPNGVIQVYYSSEAYNSKFPQVIEMQDSTNGGRTWKGKRIVCENEYSRDGMFSVVSLGGHRLLGTFEATDGLNPFVVKYVVSQNDGRTWSARTLLYAPQDINKRAAAPFVVRTGNGALVVSFQTDQFGNQDSPQAVEMGTLVSVDGGKSWSDLTTPFPVNTSDGQAAMWNSLLPIGSHTVLAASSVNMNSGSGTVEIIKGQLQTVSQ